MCSNSEVRWSNLQLIEDAPTDGALPLFARRAVVRRFDTPDFHGVTFYEVQARSALNRVPDASRVPFRWTVNPYRGCTHACNYCFARRTHEYLDLDSGHDFDTQIVVKVNVAERLRADLARPTWRREHVALGTNVDPYQRAEGRYRLMPGIISALADARTPFSILTKGTLILRDVDALVQASRRVDVGTAFSVGFLDETLWRSVESGTPAPRRRLDACKALSDAGLRCGVLVAPILPYLTDDPESLESTVAAAAEAGAAHVTPIVLHLRPGAREWYGRWLRLHHPELVPRYEALYRNGSYAPKSYQEDIAGLVREFAERYAVGKHAAKGFRGQGEPEPPPTPTRAVDQLTLY